jgi:hypothetical protein
MVSIPHACFISSVFIVSVHMQYVVLCVFMYYCEENCSLISYTDLSVSRSGYAMKWNLLTYFTLCVPLKHIFNPVSIHLMYFCSIIMLVCPHNEICLLWIFARYTYAHIIVHVSIKLEILNVPFLQYDYWPLALCLEQNTSQLQTTICSPSYLIYMFAHRYLILSLIKATCNLDGYRDTSKKGTRLML